MYLWWFLQRGEALKMFLQTGATESSGIIGYWYYAAFQSASYNLFINSLMNTWESL